MQCAYGLDRESNSASNETPNSNLGEPIRRYAKNTIRKSSFLFFPLFVFTNFILKVDIIILNPIGSDKVNFNGTKKIKNVFIEIFIFG